MVVARAASLLAVTVPWWPFAVLGARPYRPWLLARRLEALGDLQAVDPRLAWVLDALVVSSLACAALVVLPRRFWRWPALIVSSALVMSAAVLLVASATAPSLSLAGGAYLSLASGAIVLAVAARPGTRRWAARGMPPPGAAAPGRLRARQLVWSARRMGRSAVAFGRKAEKGRSCPQCGRVIPAEAGFCVFCGGALSEGPADTCVSCGAALTKEQRFCTKCGVRNPAWEVPAGPPGETGGPAQTPGEAEPAPTAGEAEPAPSGEAATAGPVAAVPFAAAAPDADGDMEVEPAATAEVAPLPPAEMAAPPSPLGPPTPVPARPRPPRRRGTSPARWLIYGLAAALLIVVAIVLLPRLLGGGGGRSSLMLLSERQDNDTVDLYRYREGDDLTSDLRIVSDVRALDRGFQVEAGVAGAARFGLFGGILPNGEDILLAYIDEGGESKIVVSKSGSGSSPEELFGSDNPIAAGLDEHGIYVIEQASGSVRCYAGPVTGPVERVAKADNCYRIGSTATGSVFVAANSDGEGEELVFVGSDGQELFTTSRRSSVVPVTMTGDGSLILIPDTRGADQVIIAVDSADGAELYRSEEGPTITLLDVAAEGSGALVAIDRGEELLSVYLLVPEGARLLDEGTAVKGTLTPDGTWAVLALISAGDDEAVLRAYDLNAADAEGRELLTTDGVLDFGVSAQVAPPAVVATVRDQGNDVELLLGRVDQSLEPIADLDDIQYSQIRLHESAAYAYLMTASGDSEAAIHWVDLSSGGVQPLDEGWSDARIADIDEGGDLLVLGADADEWVLSLWQPAEAQITELAVEDSISGAWFDSAGRVLYQVLEDEDLELRRVTTGGEEDSLVLADVWVAARGWARDEAGARTAYVSGAAAYVDEALSACRADGVEVVSGGVSRTVTGPVAGVYELCLRLPAGSYTFTAVPAGGVPLGLSVWGSGGYYETGYGVGYGYGVGLTDYLTEGTYRVRINNYDSSGDWVADFELTVGPSSS